MVQANGVGAQVPAHALNEVGFGRFHDEMKMVGHEAVSVDLPGGFMAGLSEGFEEILAIHIIEENILAAVAAAHDVINRAWIFNAKLAGHGRSLQEVGSGGQGKNEPIYGLTPFLGKEFLRDKIQQYAEYRQFVLNGDK